MISVQVNGQALAADYSRITTMPDLVEFIKANIDPDSIIVDLAISNKPLSEIDWRVPLSVQGDSIMQVSTASKEEYLKHRLSISIEYVDKITEEFRIARENFQNGRVIDGNGSISKAVTDLEAFLSWYNTVILMLPEARQASVKNGYSEKIKDITSTCDQLLQQQLYQSWWAIGETLEQRMEPTLGELKTYCQEISQGQLV
ncbi:MAG: hypothetical protein IT291_06260 [Deltaproteobacteria bacterium]|nr:hypothetical protein [Deltaproteobacteria bacterium]